ncbi:MAG: hypothetical protein J7498_05410 [Sphingobium sp.]|nr:hypothetical protein [Sphingobium sp.]
MSPEDREVVTHSIANLWSMHAIFIANLLYAMREEGFSPERIEALLQGMDHHVDVLHGEHGKAQATGLLATVRTMLSNARP